MTKSILITGGNGFIARSLFESFTNSYFSPLEPNVVSLNRDDLDLLDTTKVSDYLKDNYFDVVIHTATHDAVPEFTGKKHSDVLDVNLKMFFNLAHCSDYFGKMLYFGSGAETGRENWKPRMTEDYIEGCVPDDPYGNSKYLMNKYTVKSNNIYNLRLFGLFGKFDDWRYRFISNACCKAVLGMPITLKKDAIFDYLYISDLIEIVKWFMENSPRQHSYNICTGETTSYMSLAAEVIAMSGKKLEIAIEDGGRGVEYSGDNSRFLKEHGNFRFTPMREAISYLYQWYLKNKSIIKQEDFLY